MRTTWKGLALVAAIGCTAHAGRAATGEPAPAQKHPAPAVKPQNPEVRPSTPEDEALKRVLKQRMSNKTISLSSGPCTRPHKVLGNITVETKAPPGEASPKPGPNLYLNELLRNKAIETYGEATVDGIMSITYEPPRNGKLRATGTAVRYEEASDKGK